MVSSKLDSSDKLKTVLLSGYKVFGDYLWGYDPRYPQDKTWAAPSEVVQPTRSRHAVYDTGRSAPHGYKKI